MRKKFKKFKQLDTNEIAQARVLRDQEGLTWTAIGKILGCHNETVRRAIDAEFNVLVAERRKKRSAMRAMGHIRECQPRPLSADTKPLSSEERREHRAVVASDAAFCNAMRAAIALKQERAIIGINRGAATDSPRYVPGYRPIHGAYSSPAAMCADIGSTKK